MTAAFAAVARKGVSVQPYGITKVTTADGRLLYQRAPERGSTLVDGWVAAGITDLLQTAVNTGTGRAAQIGRPVAGKTGTTSSNKDRSDEHTSELQSLMRISYAVFCLKKKKENNKTTLC